MQFTSILFAGALAAIATALPSPVNSAQKSCKTLVPTLENTGRSFVEKRQNVESHIFNASITEEFEMTTVLRFENVPRGSFQYTLKVNLPSGAKIATTGNPALKITKLPDTVEQGLGILAGEFTPKSPFSQDIITIAPPAAPTAPATSPTLLFLVTMASNSDEDGSVTFGHSTNAGLGDKFVGFFLTFGDCH